MTESNQLMVKNVLRAIAVKTDAEACNSCVRQFGWRDRNSHCAWCGACLESKLKPCEAPECELARLLGES